MLIKNYKFIFFVFAIILASIFLFNDSSIFIYNKNKEQTANINGGIGDSNGYFTGGGGTNSITGIICKNYNRRPIAVMMANDPVARPLSGISSADLIIEMPVITGSITRILAFFVCNNPSEIGALRSARHDFIPLAMGFDAIFVHWGGSYFALDKLDKGKVDNINALYNPFGTFYRKFGLPAPHNGFTSYDRLWLASQKLGYRSESKFDGYFFTSYDKCDACQNGRLAIDYSIPYNVYYDYNAVRNGYLRFRGGYPEIDKLNSAQVEAKNVIIMRAVSRPIDDQYNDVDVEGDGKAIIYKNGIEISGSWKKDKENMASKLYFFDDNGAEVKFTPGKIIIEIVEPYQKISWSI
ncbi:MAG: DUF3048 domain-containing protein [Patescibacteria group bacterium]